MVGVGKRERERMVIGIGPSKLPRMNNPINVCVSWLVGYFFFVLTRFSDAMGFDLCGPASENNLSSR